MLPTPPQAPIDNITCPPCKYALGVVSKARCPECGLLMDLCSKSHFRTWIVLPWVLGLCLWVLASAGFEMYQSARRDVAIERARASALAMERQMAIIDRQMAAIDPGHVILPCPSLPSRSPIVWGRVAEYASWCATLGAALLVLMLLVWVYRGRAERLGWTLFIDRPRYVAAVLVCP